MRKLYSLVLLLNFITIFAFGQTCPANSNPNESYKWPTHSKWYFGKGNILNFGTNGTTTPTAIAASGSGSPFTGYESCASASDESGNMVLFTNGVDLWDKNGAKIAVPGGRLKTGSEKPDGDAGSAVQGVLIAKHPLDTNRYYIFTTDDAIYGRDYGITNGFNYYVYTKSTNSVSAATRLGSYRSTEQVAATWHVNGVDVWICSHGSTPAGDDSFYSYLLSCSGLNTTPVVSNSGFKSIANTGHDNERASLEFSQDGTKAAQTHHNGSGTWDPPNAVQILSFNKTTGVFSGAQGIVSNNAYSAPYDCEFSASGNRLYVSNQCNVGSELGYYNLSAGNTYTSLGSFPNSQSGILKLGGDGNIYTGNFKDCGGWAYQSTVGRISTPDGTPSYNASAIAFPSGSVGWGLPNMFIPPRDWLEIQTPPTLTKCDLPYNFATKWLCKTTDAENTPLYENAYTILTKPAGSNPTIDPITGVFNTDKDGTYKIQFQICTIFDTLTFAIGTCGCEADINNTAREVCPGTNYTLDPLRIKSSGPATWTITSSPAGATNPATITFAAGDTLFTTTGATTPGVYKVMYTINGQACKDSVLITVNPKPDVTVNNNTICTGGAAKTFTATTTATTPTYLWKFNTVAVVGGTTSTTSGAVAGNYTVEIIDNKTCKDTATGVLKVNALPVVTVRDTAICTGDAAISFTAKSDTTAASYLWSVNGNGTLVSTSGKTAGNYTVQVTDKNGCIGTKTAVLTVNTKPNVTVANMSICAGGTAATFTATTTATSPSYLWKYNGTAIVGGTTSTTTGSNAGNYTVEITDNKSCKDTATGVLKVNAKPVVTIRDTTVCVGKTASFTANSDTTGVSYLWSGLSTQTTKSVSIIAATTGIVTATVTDKNNCVNSGSGTLTVSPLKDATITSTNDSLRYCLLDPDPTVTVAQGGGSWNSTAVTLVGTTATIDLSALGVASGTYLKLVYTLADPCGDKDSIWVTTTAILDATITQAGPYCNTDTVTKTLKAVDAGGTWSGPGIISATKGTFRPSTAGPGSHVITYSIPGNCGDTKTMTIVVNATPDANIINTNTSLCRYDNPLTLTTTTPGGTWTSAASTNGALNTTTGIFNPKIAPNPGGASKIYYSFGGLCPAKDSVIITVIDTLAITITHHANMCANSAASPVLVNQTTGTWGGTGISTTGTFTPTAALANGTNPIVLTYSIGGTCPVSKTDTIRVLPVKDPSIGNYGPYCSQDAPVSIVPLVDAGGTYTASCGACINAVTGVFNPATAGAGSHTVTYSFAGQCATTDNTTIEVQDAENITSTPISPICERTSNQVQFTASPTGGTWTGIGNVNVTSTGVFTPNNPAGNYKAAYEYQTSAGCKSYDTLDIEIMPVPAVDFIGTIIQECVAFTETFTDLTDLSTVSLASSSWNFGNGLTSTSMLTATTPYSLAGSYDVSLTNTYSNGCKSTLTKPGYITGWEIPIAEFTWQPNPATIVNKFVNFNNTSIGGATYEWDLSDKFSPTTSTDEYPFGTFLSETDDTTTVTLITTSINGCKDTVSHPVIIQDVFSVFVPNAFTPNKFPDGVNDTFYPEGRNMDPDNYEFMVFDRWGLLIWKSKTIGEGWDGSVQGFLSSGDIQQIDVYVWRLNVSDIYTGKDYKLVGTVTLVK